MKMNNKTAIVTGAGQEIGRHIAFRLARDGAYVYATDIVKEKAEETASLIEQQYGKKARALKTDVTDEDEVASLIETVMQYDKKIDILINNAGIPGPVKQIEDVSYEEWAATIAVNLTGVFFCCKYCVPVMKEQRQGNIVNISSASGKRPMGFRLPYATTKMGVIGFTRSLALEVGKWNIRVNSVCPGSVVGPRQSLVFEGIMKSTGKSWEEVAKEKKESAPLHSFVDPEDVASVVSFLVSEDSNKITGEDINVSAGAVMY
jgi:NAD(P)-dependent dehydrogenase (short-subunit alcohol dehydrogenase family)